MSICRSLDLETTSVVPRKRGMTAEDRLDALQIAWVCITRPGTDKVQHFRGKELDGVFAALQGKVVTGWAIVSHDLPLLERKVGRKLELAGVDDLCYKIYHKTKKLYGLDEVARHTLGRGKLEKDCSIPELVRQKRMHEVGRHCADHAELAKNLWTFVKCYGYLLKDDGRISLSVTGGVEPWKEPLPRPPTASQIRALHALGLAVPSTASKARTSLHKAHQFWQQQHEGRDRVSLT